MVSETNQLYDIGQGITFFLCCGTSYNRWIDYGIGVPKLFGRKMVIRHFEFILQVLQH